ncbi:MAG: EscU/YscU/HrcU family type III secretion system export apparatus switch protein [Planctomycetota bacterium]
MNRELAIALGYRPHCDRAPRVLGSGVGRWADRIRAVAARHGIPVHQDADLATLLEQVPLADEIPPELYPAIAEIFVYLLRLARERRESS